MNVFASCEEHTKSSKNLKMWLFHYSQFDFRKCLKATKNGPKVARSVEFEFERDLRELEVELVLKVEFELERELELELGLKVRTPTRRSTRSRTPSKRPKRGKPTEIRVRTRPV